MKIRLDYVSNSSSSSFIIIAKTGADCTSGIRQRFAYASFDDCCFPNDSGKHKFGWEFENTYDFGGKMNFVAFQLLYLQLIAAGSFGSYYAGNPTEDFNRNYEMTKNVCREKFGFDFCLNYDILKGGIREDPVTGKYKPYVYLDYDWYIDHQSSVTENSCMEMFESEDTLYDFLRFSESYVQGGNDNV